MPFEIASWWEPENAVNTNSPAYGSRIETCISVKRSYVSLICCIFVKFNLESTPWECKFIATVTISKLPVRSPFPNNVPSKRSAPANTPSSAVATPVPRSLCGWSDNTTLSRYFKCLLTYSIWLAKTWGIAFSTVDGILMIAFLSAVGCHTSRTALHTSTA